MTECMRDCFVAALLAMTGGIAALLAMTPFFLWRIRNDGMYERLLRRFVPRNDGGIATLLAMTPFFL